MNKEKEPRLHIDIDDGDAEYYFGIEVTREQLEKQRKRQNEQGKKEISPKQKKSI